VGAEAIPEHVAAYAAALHVGTRCTWSEVAAIVAKVGLGAHRYDELARAAMTWQRAHVRAGAVRALRRQIEGARARGRREGRA